VFPHNVIDLSGFHSGCSGFSFWSLLLHFVWKSIGNNWKFPGNKWKKPGNFWKKQPFFGNFSAKLEISHNLIKQ